MSLPVASRHKPYPLRVVGVSVAFCALAWFYLWRMEQDMPGMAGAIYTVAWTASFASMILGMWVVMMVAMMMPAALPMLLLVSRLKRPAGGFFLPHTAAFALGYFLVWMGFGGLLTGVQWLLNRIATGYGVALGQASLFGVAVLMLSGLYQWSPWKNACLKHCQTPLGFLLSHWRDGRWGSLRMGFGHGIFCVGCCWLLMALMLVGGAMDLAWMFSVTVYLLLERTLPARLRLERISGAVLIGVGIALLAGYGLP